MINGIPFSSISFKFSKIGAPSAAYAFFGSVSDLASLRLRFRVVAPDTPQRTALKKYRRSDSRAVVGAKSLNIYYRTLHAHTPF